MDTIAVLRDTILMPNTINKLTSITSKEEIINATIAVCCNYVLLIFIIILAGIIGGCINYLTSEQDSYSTDGEKKVLKFLKNRKFHLQLLLGISGSALIPLLLYLTSSTLFKNSDNCFFSYFVFAGYCIIGAIFSRSMLDSLAKRLNLEEIKQKVIAQETVIKEQNKEIEATKKIVVETKHFIEDKDLKDSEEEEISTQSHSTEIDLNVSDKDVKFNLTSTNDYISKALAVLTNLKGSTTKNRTIKSIMKGTQITSSEIIKDILLAFEEHGLVAKVKWYGNDYYQLTDKGRKTEKLKSAAS